jgi:hypothetical protein
VETEPGVLVALLAIRTVGGRSAPASHEVVKSLKKPIVQAISQGLLREETLTEQVPVEGKKKPKVVKSKVLALTQEGERRLRESASPEAMAATQLRVVSAQAEALRRSLDADREALKAQVQAALAAKGRDKEAAKHEKEVGKLSAEIAKIARSVQVLADKVQQLEARRPQAESGEGGLAAKIDEGFAALRARLDHALQGLSTPPQITSPAPAGDQPAAGPHTAAPPKSAASAVKPPTAPPAHDSLQAVLRRAYDELKAHYREYQEGMVELPRLYHEARRSRPDLTVGDFHRELLTLEGKRVLDLHIRNEVRDAPEPDKAIRRNDKLYYFVYWPRS